MKGNPGHPCNRDGTPAGRRLAASWKPLVAIGLAVFLLSGGLNTLALWGTTQALGNQNLTAGAFNLTAASPVITLNSQITVGQRTYSSGTTCTATAPYTECREVTSTLAAERLVPGDKVTITRQYTVAATGNNMIGKLQVDVSQVLLNTGAACPGDLSNDYACAATITASVTNPDNSTTTINSAGAWKVDRPVNGATGVGVGNYTVTWSMAVPPNNAGADWLEKLMKKTVTFGALNVTLAQV